MTFERPENKSDSTEAQINTTAAEDSDSTMPNGFPGEMPDGFDTSDMPDGFDPSDMQGGFGGNFPSQSSGGENDDVPSDDTENNGENAGNRPDGGNMQMPGGNVSFDMNENNAPTFDMTAWILLAVSVVVLAVGLIVAKKYRA